MNDWIDRSRFALHPGVRMGQTILGNLEKSLGKPRDDWHDWLKGLGLQTREKMDAYLAKKFKLGTNQRRALIDHAMGQNLASYEPSAYFELANAYIQAQYSGKREGLRPVYIRCIQVLSGLGPDVRFSPCKSYVPAYRRHVFAHVIPATQTRIDLGLALGDYPPNARLKSTGGLAKGDRITHKVGLKAVEDLDESLMEWIHLAYDSNKG